MGRETFAACLGLLACACGPSIYAQPALPASQLALVMVESRARTEGVDGHPLVYDNLGKTPEKFWVTATCHELAVSYEETYVREGGGVFIVVGLGSPLLAAVTAATMAGSAASAAAGTTVRTYETEQPVRFNLPAKPGTKYWVTSSFDGDKFMPRIAVLDEADERVGVILPEQPCPSASKPASTP